MANKEQHPAYTRPKKITAVKIKHPRGFGTDKERGAKKEWFETKCNGILHKGTKASMMLVSHKCEADEKRRVA